MPKKDVNSNKFKRLSYDGTETNPNITARPTRIIVGMFKRFHIRRTNIGEE